MNFFNFCFFFFLFKISTVEDDGSILLKFFNYVCDKVFWMNDLEYSISPSDVAKVIQPSVIWHISKKQRLGDF